MIYFSIAELEKAWELEFKAKSEGSVGDQSGQPTWPHTNRVPFGA